LADARERAISVYSLATPFSRCKFLLLSNSIRKTIWNEVQFNVEFEERFSSGEHERKALSGIERELRGLGLASWKTFVRDADECRAIGPRLGAFFLPRAGRLL